GDGAGAVVLGQTELAAGGRGILSSRIHADGCMADVMRVPGGGSREPMDHARLEARRHFLRWDGPALKAVTIKHLSTYSMQALKSARLTSAELDWVIPLQANRTIVEAISERLGYPLSKFILNLERYGNTMAASIPIALDEGIRDGRLEAGHTALVCALGAGISWGAMLIRL
ncbi:MAG: 3-oxoacyl-[acyl-carrier-protein] synthase III C-terminal domain-containing protein, partial [Myxococcota bacterium]